MDNKSEKYIAGIDYSMSSPAVCVHKNKEIKDFNDCYIFFYTDVVKYQKQFGNIMGMRCQKFKNQQERFDDLSEWVITILNKFDIKQVYLEGYSFSSKGQVFQIGENTGVLKHKLNINGIKFDTPPPSEVKLSFTGKGNAKKELMLEAFENKFQVGLKEKIGYNKEKIESPIADIVDCVAVFNNIFSKRENIKQK